MQHDRIAVIDFGGQYAHLIATKVRRERVLAEILQPEDASEVFRQYKGIILSGSPSLSAFAEDSKYNKEIYDLDIPILGFCFGHQEIAKQYGGKVIHGNQEWGRADLNIVREHPLFKGLERTEQVWMSHFDSVVEVGPDFEELGFTSLGSGGGAHRFAAIGSDKHRRYGFQFHPEVDDTLHGSQMIGNFVREICDCKPSWTVENYLNAELEKVKKLVGNKSVFLLASGGVDSTVAACLLGRALGPERLHLLHIDTGLMRKAESEEVLSSFKEMGLGKHLHFVDASEDFISALAGAVESEEKRAIIGKTFIDIFERKSKELGIESYLLGQGTIYPDTIETGGTKRADTIKTHHNRVPIIEEMIAAGKVVEPLAELYKVEVRELGEKLGVPQDMLWRQPFPGPGLGVRLLCSDGASNGTGAEELSKLTSAVKTLLKSTSFEVAALPIKSVGVKADLRSYEHPVMLSGHADWDTLQDAAGRIFKTVPGINRCLWNLSPKAPREFKRRAAQVTRERLDLLREADHLVMEGLRRHGIYREIWQCPVVLVPLEIDGAGKELCIIRPIYSQRGMTATAARVPAQLLKELSGSILALPGISGMAYDLTSKPPGTIEWE